MKILLFVVCGLFFTSHVYSYDSSLFYVDEDRINSELAEISNLESFISINTHFVIQDINKNPDFQHIKLINRDSSDVNVDQGPPLGIPSFAWGLCLSIPGVVLVYYMSGDQEELKKAMIGCIIGTGLLGGCYSLIYGLSAF